MSEHLSLKETVNLPQTDFNIRASLASIEPDLLKKWEETELYKAIKQKQATASATYVLHDGPPYPNGNIHMGHALNKILKDIIVRIKIMTGHSSPYIPGWDCHGLPIETQVLKELKTQGQEEKKRDIPWFRNRCKEFALSYVETQKKDFQRLGVMGEWEQPYLTLTPSYEANVIRQFGRMAANGLIYKGRKPIHWCTHCETALAEAEIEYADHRSPSIYVTFRVTEPSPDLSAILKGKEASVLVWTTTPWTLPANVAVAAHPSFQYVVFHSHKGVFICAEGLQNMLCDKLELTDTWVLGTLNGKSLFATQTRHPFLERLSGIVTADYVTQEDGTGFVHIAPGHGQDDYQVGLLYKLDMIMPVDEKGRFTSEVEWVGQPVFEANKAIGQRLEEKQNLLKLVFIKHSYPHCWRCKNPVIFRATPQWFVALDVPMKHLPKTLREASLEAIQTTKWYPAWGENRIYAMIQNRPDWCISRQRFWGIPIPVLTCSCGHSALEAPFIEAIAHMVEKEGTSSWFSKSPQDILSGHPELVCTACGTQNFHKEQDILDVWFESGSSFSEVVQSRLHLDQANLYLEGSDQHRGWFHSSLLIGIGSNGKAPYKEVLTHGFLVDDKGRKMSKSIGNVISPDQVIRDYGADVLRWWIAHTDFKNDIGLSPGILNQCRDSYSKVRNTIRFCLSNLYDFDAAMQILPYEHLQEIDQWALFSLNELIQTVTTFYHEFDFHQATYAIHEFCTVKLSSLYLDMVKDRLYCDHPTSQTRLSTQTTLHIIADTLIRLTAPILAFTAEDAYRYFKAPHKASSIHLESFPTVQPAWNELSSEKWTLLLRIRDEVYQKLEKLRSDKLIKSFLETKVTLPGTLTQALAFKDFPSLLIVSQVEISNTSEKITIEKLQGDKCGRCWKFVPLHNGICSRCETTIYA